MTSRRSGRAGLAWVVAGAAAVLLAGWLVQASGTVRQHELERAIAINELRFELGVAKDMATAAERNAARARSAGLAAASDGVAMADPMRALLLAREAVRAAQTPAAVAALRRTLLASMERRTFQGPETGVACVAWSPDGRLVVAGGEDGVAQLWDTETGMRRATLRGHEESIRAVAWSPGGDLVVTASDDATARLWRPDGTLVTTLAGATNGIVAAAFSAKGDVVLTASRDGTARIFGVDGAARAVLTGHEGPVTEALFSPAGDRVLTASSDRTARLWKLDGTELAVLRGHDDGILAAAWSPRGDRVATVSKDGTARLWDADGNEIAKLEGHVDSVACLAFTPKGDRLATGGEDGTVRMWSPGGELLATFAVHAARVTSIAFTRDGRRFVTSSWDGTAQVFDTRGPRLAAFVPRAGWLDAAVWSPREDRIVTCSRGGSVRVWAADPCEVAALRGHEDGVRCLAFTDGGLISGSEDATARVWDWDRLGSRDELTLRCGDAGVVAVEWEQKEETTFGTFSPQRWRVTSRDGTVRSFDVKGACLETSSKPVTPEPSARRAERDGFVAEVTSDGVVIVRSGDTTIAEIQPGTSRVGALALSKGAPLDTTPPYVATGHYDGLVRIWAVAAADLLRVADARCLRDLTPAERALYPDLLPPQAR